MFHLTQPYPQYSHYSHAHSPLLPQHSSLPRPARPATFFSQIKKIPRRPNVPISLMWNESTARNSESSECSYVSVQPTTKVCCQRFAVERRVSPTATLTISYYWNDFDKRLLSSADITATRTNMFSSITIRKRPVNWFHAQGREISGFGRFVPVRQRDWLLGE